MKRTLKWLVVLNLFLSSWTASAQAPGREFIMSCTYGVLAGTLVGAASLAFVDKPGDNLNKVARGASIGLYTGILLGLYVLYVIPNMEVEEEDPLARVQNMPFMLNLTFNDLDRPDGLKADWTVLRF